MKSVKRMIILFLIMGMLVPSTLGYASEIDDEEEEVVILVSSEEDGIEADAQDGAEPSVNVSVDDLDKNLIIHEGVSIGKTDVSGMTPAEALEVVASDIAAMGQTPVIVEVDDRNMESTLDELGFFCDNAEQCVVESTLIGEMGTLITRYKEKTDILENPKTYDLHIGVAKETLESYISENADDYTVKPVNATIKRSGDGFDISESIKGMQIDQGATIDAIIVAFDNWKQEEQITVEAAKIVLEPAYDSDDLKQIKDCLGSFHTSLTSSPNSGKGKNVSIGAGKIDGTVIMPGEEWSIYNTLAPFTADNGYDEAIAYQNGGYVQELGGGVCQLATTLYNAALRAEITVSERFHHQMTVGYTDVSFDATVNDYGSKDLKLKNDFDFPVYIEAYFANSRVNFNIYGVETRDPRRTLGFRSEVLSEEMPTEVEETPDPSLPAGTRKVVQQAYPKVVAKAYKLVYYDGVLQEEIYLHTDNYHASPQKVLVGVGGVPAPAPETPTEGTPGEETPTEGGENPEAPAPEAPAPEAPAPAPEAPAPEAPAPAPEAPAA